MKSYKIQRLIFLLLLLALIGVGAAAPMSAGANRPLPQFTDKRAKAWLNTKPLTVEGLRDNVVLVVVWTSI